MPTATLNRPLPQDKTFTSATIGSPKTYASQVKVDVTFWTDNSIPTIRTYTLKSKSRNRYWDLLEQVCLVLKDMGIMADNVLRSGYYSPDSSNIRYLWQHHEPESLKGWLCKLCGGWDEYEEDCQECGGTGDEQVGVKTVICDFCDGEGTVWLPCYSHEHV